MRESLFESGRCILPIMLFLVLFAGCSTSYGGKQLSRRPVPVERSSGSDATGRSGLHDPAVPDSKLLVTKPVYGSTLSFYTDKVTYRNHGQWVEFIDSSTGQVVVLDSRDLEVKDLR